MASVMAPFAYWLDTSSLFHSSTTFDIQALPLSQIDENEASHRLQRFGQTWTISSSDPAALTKLRLVTPGLTIVRVNPQLRARFGGDMVARVRVTSDEASHVNCVSVASKKCHELRVVFTNATDGESESDMGSLVTEIDLAHASQITEILAMGGGDVTVHGGVLISDIDHGIMLIALHETKLSIDERQREHFQLKDLLIGSASSGEIFISTNDLTVLSTFAIGVLGNGRVHVVAERAWAKTTQQSLVGEYGTIQMQTSHGLATSELSVAVLGSGYATIQSSSAVEIDEHTTCAKMDLRVEGSGRIDVAGMPSARTRVKIRENGRVVAQLRLKLELDCSDDGVVECVGSLPPSVQTSSEFRADAIVLTSHHDRMVQQRVVRATAPVAQIPVTPTVERAFDAVQWLHVVKAGFRDTFLRPFFQSL